MTSHPFTQDLSYSVWKDTYKWETDTNVYDTFRRVATFVASVEEDKKLWEQNYYELLSEFKYVPGGRILSNAGTGLKKTTLINCFASSFEGKNRDSIDGIYRELTRQAKILSSEGGYGCNFDVLRPCGSFVRGIAVETSGVLAFMGLWDKSSEVLTRGSGRANANDKGKKKIRKGAMLGALSVWHPSIEEFITIKQTPGEMTKFNLSVLITDEFMDAVKTNKPWDLIFPDTSFDKYDAEWDGNINRWKDKDYPIVVWKTFQNANELWDLILKSNYNRNEPGILFIDRINQLNNLYHSGEEITTTNPCISGDSVIETTEGRLTIEYMANEHVSTGRTFDVYSVNIETGELEIKRAIRILKTKHVNKIAYVHMSNGTVLKCTPDHKIYDANSMEKIAVEDIKKWLDTVSPNSYKKIKKYRPIYFQRTKASEHYLRVKVSTQKEYFREHRFVAGHYFRGDISYEYDVHHIDGNTFNNSYTNLEVIPHSCHSIMSNIGHRDWSERCMILGRFKKKEYKLKKSSSTPPDGVLTKNTTSLLNFKKIEIVDEDCDVFDMTVEDNHNYIANGLCISNCGEQPLPTNASCNLGSINLTQYIKNGKFYFEQLEKDIPVIVRFQDSITDLTNFPLPEQKKEAQLKRRSGIGYMGYASALYLMKVAYGSKKALKITEELCAFVTNKMYQASALLAKEKGAFPAYVQDEYLKSGFINQALSQDTINLIKLNGIRNSHLTTLAPTGNSSVFSNNVSGGLEPIVSAKYIRTVMVVTPPEGFSVPKSIDWDHQKYDTPNGWDWVMEGDEFILKKVVSIDGNDVTFKIDRNRGLCREESVYDYSVLVLGEEFWKDKADSEENKTEFYGKTLFDLTIEDHLNTMAIFAKYVDSSVSKTINVPNDYPYEDFKKVYEYAYDTGVIKGVTTYRWGTMTSVLSTESTSKKSNNTTIPERPKALPCHVHKITVHGEKWLVLVGLKDGKPWEVFAGKIGLVDIPSKITDGMIVKEKRGIYCFEYDGEVIVKDINQVFQNEIYEAKTRILSISLQHGTPIWRIVEQLSKSKGTIVDFSKSIIRALKKYIPDDVEIEETCPSCMGAIVYSEGCYKCRDCGWTKCG